MHAPGIAHHQLALENALARVNTLGTQVHSRMEGGGIDAHGERADHHDRVPIYYRADSTPAVLEVRCTRALNAP